MSHYEWRRESNRVLLGVLVFGPGDALDLTSVSATALLDTGATTSGISLAIARELALPTMDKRPVQTANGLLITRRFLSRLGLPQHASPAPFVFDDTLGFELKDDISWPVLIGMDILSRCDFTMRRDGRCTLAFG